MVVGNNGGPNSSKGNGPKNLLEVHIDETHTRVVSELFFFNAGITSTIASDANAGAIQIEIVSTTGFNTGDVIQIINGTIEPTFPIITDIPGGNILVLDRPLDFSYNIGDSVEIIITNVSSIIGALGVPIIYRFQPDSDRVWFVNKLQMTMTHNSAASDDKFGNLTALTNGFVFRSFVNGQFRSIANWKSNANIKLDVEAVTYSDKAGPGLFGTTVQDSINLVGATLKLDGFAGDYLDILIQDDLTGLESFYVNGQGYVEAA